MIESLLGFKLVDEEKVPVDRDEYPGSELIHRTTSKSKLVKEILKRQPGKTDEEVLEEFTEWYKVWSERPVDHFDLKGLNDTMDRLSGIQKRTLIDWVRKTESLFIQMKFEKNVIVDVRLKS
jgi:argonaute-like protein implicated in RNA metabolism and viral defense